MSKLFSIGNMIEVLPSFINAADKLSKYHELNRMLIGRTGKVVSGKWDVGYLIEFTSNINNNLHNGATYGYTGTPDRCWFIPGEHLKLYTVPILQVEIGSKVKVLKHYESHYTNTPENNLLIGHTGIVIDIETKYGYGCLVEFKKNHNEFQHNGHNMVSLSGKPHRCWFVPKEYLELVPKKMFLIGDKVIIKPNYIKMKYCVNYNIELIGMTGIITTMDGNFYKVAIGNNTEHRIHKKFLKLEV